MVFQEVNKGAQHSHNAIRGFVQAFNVIISAWYFNTNKLTSKNTSMQKIAFKYHLKPGVKIEKKGNHATVTKKVATCSQVLHPHILIHTQSDKTI